MKRINALTSHKMYMFTLFKRIYVNTCVYLHSHSLQAIETCRTSTFFYLLKKKKKASHEMPPLVTAVKAQMTDTCQPYT